MGIPLRTEPYTKTVIRERPDAKGVMYHKYWGAIGDFYYCLTFLSPFLRRNPRKKRVLAADVYSRYIGNPLLELCEANGLIDELWTHSRAGAGPTLCPPEFLEQARNPKPGIELFRAGIYYDRYLVGPGVLPYPVEELRVAARRKPRYLIPLPEESKVYSTFPVLENPYITLHPFTFGKTKRNRIPIEVIRELGNLDVQVIVLMFLTDNRYAPYYDSLKKVRGITILPIPGVIESLWVQRYAKVHVGIESSQVLGAAIYDVPVLYFPFGTTGHFENDLGIKCHNLGWNTLPSQVADMVRRLLDGEPAV